MGVSDPQISQFATVSSAGRERTLALLRERIVAFAASRIARDAAEDLVQEVLLLLHEKYAHVEALEELVPLSLRILRFKMAAQFRKEHRRGEDTATPVDEMPLAGPEPNPETLAERRELTTRLEKAVRKLPGKCKELFRMKLEGKGFAEIQQAYGAKSINTVYTWDFRCRKQLLELMGGSWGRER
ncbi:MAG TPA: sigma-70 family RNA polymerase sigma factor [Bryobacteraceae bacterium]|nr:sigma-70 family RNA polymerase sigma factor [Bryobacteraceae bacterium]